MLANHDRCVSVFEGDLFVVRTELAPAISADQSDVECKILFDRTLENRTLWRGIVEEDIDISELDAQEYAEHRAGREIQRQEAREELTKCCSAYGKWI